MIRIVRQHKLVTAIATAGAIVLSGAERGLVRTTQAEDRPSAAVVPLSSSTDLPPGYREALNSNLKALQTLRIEYSTDYTYLVPNLPRASQESSLTYLDGGKFVTRWTRTLRADRQ